MHFVAISPLYRDDFLPQCQGVTVHLKMLPFKNDSLLCKIPPSSFFFSSKQKIVGSAKNEGATEAEFNLIA